MNKIGSSIRTLRKQHGMTQDELATALHVTRQTVSNYENGKSEPDIDTLLHLSEIFGTDVNTLLDTKIPATPPKHIPNYKVLIMDIVCTSIAFLIAHHLLSAANLWGSHHYDMSFIFTVCTIVYPLCSLLLGRNIIHCLEQMFPFPPQKPWYTPVHYMILILTAVNLLLYLPLLIWTAGTLGDILIQLPKSFHLARPAPFDTRYLPTYHAWFLLEHPTMSYFLYTLCGAILRLTKRTKTEVT